MIFKKLFAGRDEKPPHRGMYEAIVAQARQPYFYSDLSVPDTLDGRFEMITMHAFLVLDRLSGNGEVAANYSQELFNEMFADMDRSLREMGASDVSVGKKVRKMAEVFYGRSGAYRSALSAKEDAPAKLQDVIARNFFPKGAEIADDQKARSSNAFADYMLKSKTRLEEQELDKLLSGQPDFPAPQEALAG